MQSGFAGLLRDLLRVAKGTSGSLKSCKGDDFEATCNSTNSPWCKKLLCATPSRPPSQCKVSVLRWILGFRVLGIVNSNISEFSANHLPESSEPLRPRALETLAMNHLRSC